MVGGIFQRADEVAFVIEHAVAGKQRLDIAPGNALGGRCGKILLVLARHPLPVVGEKRHVVARPPAVFAARLAVQIRALHVSEDDADTVRELADAVVERCQVVDIVFVRPFVRQEVAAHAHLGEDHELGAFALCAGDHALHGLEIVRGVAGHHIHLADCDCEFRNVAHDPYAPFVIAGDAVRAACRVRDIDYITEAIRTMP